MKTVCLASLSGGTGKSLCAAVLGKIMPDTLMADVSCSHTGLRTFAGGEPFRIMEHGSGLLAKRFLRLCERCGRCMEVCPQGAIDPEGVDACLCTGCGACRDVCPNGAIELGVRPAGRWYYADTDAGLLVDTDLAGALVHDTRFPAQVFTEAKKLAEARDARFLVVDLPAGITEETRPVLEAADLVVLVLGPAARETARLRQHASLLRTLGGKVCLCVNRDDLHPETTMDLIDLGLREGFKTIGRLPYEEGLLAALETAQAEKTPFFGLIPNPLKQSFARMMVSAKFLLEEGE